MGKRGVGIKGVPLIIPVGCSHVFMGFIVMAIYINLRLSYLIIKFPKVKVWVKPFRYRKDMRTPQAAFAQQKY